MNKPHKSTTHEEMFFHIDNKGTVFFRKEGEQWYYSLAIKSSKDQFCRKSGRCVARRKYFQGKRNNIPEFMNNNLRMNYNCAEYLFDTAYINHHFR